MIIEIDGRATPDNQDQNLIRQGSTIEDFRAIAKLADTITPEVLDLRLPVGKRAFEYAWVSDWLHRMVGESDWNIPTLGEGLKDGTVAFKGNIGLVNNLQGGTVFVDGDVNKIVGFKAGIVYVSGDVNLIENSDNSIIIVAGEINKYIQRRHPGGSNPEIHPSPYIFTSKPVEMEIPDDYGISNRGYVRHNTVEYPVPPTVTVSEETLRGWTPEETRTKALALCKGRNKVYLDKLRKTAMEADSVEAVTRFSVNNIFGVFTGRKIGYYEYPNLGPSD